MAWRFGLSAMDRPTRRAGRPATSPRGLCGASPASVSASALMRAASCWVPAPERIPAPARRRARISKLGSASRALRPPRRGRWRRTGSWSRCSAVTRSRTGSSLGFAFAHRPRLKAADPRDRLSASSGGCGASPRSRSLRDRRRVRPALRLRLRRPSASPSLRLRLFVLTHVIQRFGFGRRRTGLLLRRLFQPLSLLRLSAKKISAGALTAARGISPCAMATTSPPPRRVRRAPTHK